MPQETAENLHDLLVMKTQVLYDVETELTKALPKMAEAATDPDLKKGFEDHLVETRGQIERLDKVFAEMDLEPEALESDAIRGLISDAEWSIGNIKNSQALDAALLASAQSVEHYEMSLYGTAATWAEIMGHSEVKDLLGETLEEEKMADEKLNALAMSKINDMANNIMETEETKEERGGILGRMEPRGI